MDMEIDTESAAAAVSELCELRFLFSTTAICIAFQFSDCADYFLNSVDVS